MNSARLLIPIAALLVAACSDSTPPGPAVGNGRRLHVGQWTACALDKDGHTECWGISSDFQEYGVTAPSSPIPIPVPAPTLAALGGGISHHTCGLTAERVAICWGRGTQGQLGGGDFGAIGNGPTTVKLEGVSWDDIAVGRLTTCAVATNGDGYCWGLNQHGELGDTLLAASAKVSTPNKVIGGIQFKSIVPGWIHTCGIATSGSAYCWGDNSSGQLGIGVVDADAHARPLLVSPSVAFKKLSLGARSTCGITTDDQILCWGYNATGQLGDGTTTTRPSPTPIASSLKFSDISLGSGFAEGVRTGTVLPTGVAQGGIAHGCALTVGGAPYCWGWNGVGQVGDASTTTQLSPVAVKTDKKMKSIAVGGNYSCAVGDNALWCWGSNAGGQLGNSTNEDSPVPVAVIIGWP
jgi:alpha-tubulin suppressor-like RCC1 family protein